MIKHIRSGKLIARQICKYLMSTTGTQESKTSKSYRLPQQKLIEPFVPSSPLYMHNKRTLIYLNKQRLWTPALLQVPYASVFFGLIYLIRNNPWYLTFPASLPIMMGVEILAFFAWISHKKHFKYIIERIYLYDSNYIEFTFSNKIRRRLKNTEEGHFFQSPDQLATPLHGEDGTPAWSQKGSPFPQKLVYRQNESSGQIEVQAPQPSAFYGWSKYIANYQPYIIPKSYEYANWEILVPLLSGRYIEVSDAINETTDLEAGKEYPSTLQELKWVKEDAIKTQQAKKAKALLRQDVKES